jgi:predicted CopG family antitoxin
MYTLSMPSRTLNVTEEAYALLASLKAERESFTDVIKRLAGERPLFDVVGVLDETQAERLSQRIAAGRERGKRRRQRQLRL